MLCKNVLSILRVLKHFIKSWRQLYLQMNHFTSNFSISYDLIVSTNFFLNICNIIKTEADIYRQIFAFTLHINIFLWKENIFLLKKYGFYITWLLSKRILQIFKAIYEFFITILTPASRTFFYCSFAWSLNLHHLRVFIFVRFFTARYKFWYFSALLVFQLVLTRGRAALG